MNQETKQKNSNRDAETDADKNLVSNVSTEVSKEESDADVMTESERVMSSDEMSRLKTKSRLPSTFIEDNLRMSHVNGHNYNQDDEDINNSMFYKRRSSISFDPQSKRILFPPTTYSFTQQDKDTANNGRRMSTYHVQDKSKTRGRLPSLQLPLPPWQEEDARNKQKKIKKKIRNASPNSVSPVNGRVGDGHGHGSNDGDDDGDNSLFYARHSGRAASRNNERRLSWNDNLQANVHLSLPNDGQNDGYNDGYHTDGQIDPFDRRSPRHPRPRRGSFRKENESSSNCSIS